jgi:hypothetical protein
MNYLFCLVRLFIRDWFFGSRKALLSGNFAGWLTLPNENHDYFQFVLTEDNDHSLEIRGGVSGDDCGAFSLDGTVTGNRFQVFGQIGGTASVLDCFVEGDTIIVSDAVGKHLGTWGLVL